MRAINIAHFETSMNWGGQELRIIEQMEWLLAHGHQVWLIARPGSKILQEALRRQLPAFPLVVKGSLHPLTLLRLMKFLRRHRIELLDCHGNRDAVYAAVCRLLSGLAVVRSRHVTSTVRRGRLSDWVWRHGNHRIVVTGGAIRDNLCQLGLASAERVDVAPAGVDTERFYPERDVSLLRQELGIPVDHRVVASIGMLRPDKGQLYFVEAAADILRHCGKVTFLLVGEATADTQAYKASVMARIEELGITGQIRHVGYRHDVECFIALADVVAIASIGTEAQTRLVSQCFLSKTSVVATRVGGLPEMIEDQRTGLLVDSKAPVQMAEAIRTCLLQPELAARLADQAYSHARQFMTSEVMMSAMLETYQRSLRHQVQLASS